MNNKKLVSRLIVLLLTAFCTLSCINGYMEELWAKLDKNEPVTPEDAIKIEFLIIDNEPGDSITAVPNSGDEGDIAGKRNDNNTLKIFVRGIIADNYCRPCFAYFRSA